VHPYERDVKRRQAHFRDTSDTITDKARYPDDAVGRRHGHLLAVDSEEENLFPSLRDGRAVRFFAARRIKWWRSTRGGDPTEGAIGRRRPNGPTRNMANSQIACVNVLMPLSASRTALTAMLREIDSRVEEAEVIRYQRRGEPTHESLVEFEWVGEGNSLEGTPGTRGANTTSADALLVARMRDGSKKGFLMEWKLIEEYRRAANTLTGAAGATRRKRYEASYGTSKAFGPGRTFEDIAYDPMWQLMRMTLLGDLMAARAAADRDRECGIHESSVVVVCPRENTAYHESIPESLRHVAGQRAAEESPLEAVCSRWWSDGRLMFCSPRRLVDAVRRDAPAEMPDGWSEYMRERYNW
jgi:hypothetical protein